MYTISYRQYYEIVVEIKVKITFMRTVLRNLVLSRLVP